MVNLNELDIDKKKISKDELWPCYWKYVQEKLLRGYWHCDASTDHILDE